MQTVIIIAFSAIPAKVAPVIRNKELSLKPSLVSFSHHPYTHISASFSSSPWATPFTVFCSVFLTQPTSPRDFAVF